LSPVWQARAGSTHGYDVIDPAAISSELGGDAELRALSADARERGMGLILDVVPNHMAADDANAYWADLDLRRRFFDLDEKTGRWRRFFDIDELAGVRQVAGLPRLAESVPSLPVYRTYVADGTATDQDRAALAGCETAVREQVLAGGPFATRFQQTTPAVMAKGVEDTAFYRHT